MSFLAKALKLLVRGISLFAYLFVACVMLFAGLAVYVDFQDRQEQRIIEGWIAYEAAKPNTKVWQRSIEHLNRLGANFSDIDWSCKKIGDYSNSKESEKPVEDACKQRPNLSGINLAPKIVGYYPFEIAQSSILADVNFGYADLSDAKMRFALLIDASFDNADLSRANLNEVYLYKASFKSAKLTLVDFEKARAQKAEFGGADLSGANLTDADLRGAAFALTVFRETNLSGADFTGAKDMDKANFETIWAWRDHLPKGIDELENFKLKLCDSALKSSYSPSSNSIPDEC